MRNVTRLPPFGKKIHVEADIPARQLDEFERAITAIAAGERPRMDTLARDQGEVVSRAMPALERIEAHPGTGPGTPPVLHRWLERYDLLPRES